MTPTLQIDHLGVAYDAQPVLQGIDLHLQRGEFVALLGPNGSGKTTSLRCIAGILAPASGHVRIVGVDLAHFPREAKMQLGFAIDPNVLPDLLTGRECLALFAGARGLPGIPPDSLALAETLALTPMLDRRIGGYSLGTRQKLGIALGLLGQPPLLVLDEPLNGLDPVSAYRLKQHLRERVRAHGDTVLLATHSLDVAQRFVDRAVLLLDGRVRRQWDTAELDAIRDDPSGSLERSMVEALA